MPPSPQQRASLQDAILGYAFPANSYDFINDVPMHFPAMSGLEAYIYGDLSSGNASRVQNGLANVIYWGWAQRPGLQGVRTTRFMNGVTPAQIAQFMALLGGGGIPTPEQIRDLHMPQFNGMAFISKILAFLDPNRHCVLDKQIAQLRNPVPVPGAGNVLDQLAFGANETQIRVSLVNTAAYNEWCLQCADISTNYFNGNFRCVDVERGFYYLIQIGNVVAARGILNNT